MASQTRTVQGDEAGKKPTYRVLRPSQPLPCESPQSRRMSIDYVLGEAMDLPTMKHQWAKLSSQNENCDPSITRRTASAVTSSMPIRQALSEPPASQESRSQRVLRCNVPAATSTPKVSRPRSEPSAIQKMPHEILRDIFRFLLVSAVNIAPISNKKRGIHRNVLLTCKQFYHIGWPILYSENTFIEILTDEPGDIKSIFDLMPTRGILMITKLAFVMVDEDYRLDGLSLLAKRIQILTKLRLLWIFLPEPMDPLICEHTIVGGQHDRKATVVNRKRVRFDKESIIEIDKKALKDMLRRLKSLKKFWLIGFEDEEWAKKLERSVNFEAALFPTVWT